MSNIKTFRGHYGDTNCKNEEECDITNSMFTINPKTPFPIQLVYRKDFCMEDLTLHIYRTLYIKIYIKKNNCFRIIKRFDFHSRIRKVLLSTTKQSKLSDINITDNNWNKTFNYNGENIIN